MTSSNFSLIVSVCEASDIDIWKFVSYEVPKLFQAESYRVIVPDHQVKLFKDVSNPIYDVVPESHYSGEWIHHFESRIGSIWPERRGWYLQQLLKLSSLSQLAPGELGLIWDADTLPLKKIEFLGGNGSVHYLKGEEFHSPYFNSIYKLTKLEKQVDYSFIAQCFPIYSDWFEAFRAEVEELHSCAWEIAVIDSIDGNEISGFSEYETLGTFISNKFPDQIGTINSKWVRYGNRLLGNRKFRNYFLKNFWITRIIFFRYSSITFEKWDDHRLAIFTKLKYWFDLLVLNNPRN